MARACTTSDPFNAIAEPRRRHILEFIAGEERSVTEIADALELGQPSVSKHLQVLRDVGLVTRPPRGPAHHVSNQRRNASHDSRLERHVRPLLARTAATHQGSRRGGKMTTTAAAHDQPTIHDHRRDPGPGVTREDVRVPAHPARAPERDRRRQAAADGARSLPGGRWYRDLGGDNGHLWGFVQSIKRPVLLEIWGPLFMSTAATSNMQYRLTEVGRRLADHVQAHAGRPVPRRASRADGRTAGRRCTRGCAAAAEAGR